MKRYNKQSTGTWTKGDVEAMVNDVQAGARSFFPFILQYNRGIASLGKLLPSTPISISHSYPRRPRTT